MKRIFLTLMLFVPLMLMGQTNNDLLTNASIIKLYKNGISKEIIISKIKSSNCNFNVSTDELIKLKEAKIPDEIVNAMVDATNNNHNNNISSSTPLLKNGQDDKNNSVSDGLLSQIHDPGIYYVKISGGEQKLVQIEPNICGQVKTSVWALYLTSGLAKAKKMATLSGVKSQIQITDNSPVFYFYFGNVDDTKSSGDLSNSESSVNPNEYILIKMLINDKTHSRQFDIGSIGIISGVNSGVDDKYRIAFKSTKIKSGLYKVVCQNPLSSGEYGFMYSGENKTLKVFDFGISN